MRDLMSRLKEGLSTAAETAKRKAAETKHKIDRRLNQDLFEAIIAGCVLIMNTGLAEKSARDRASEEHKLLISLAEKGITNYFSPEEITHTLSKYMSIYESGNVLAGYGYCVAAIAQVKKDADISMLIRFMYDVSAADGSSDPVERQFIADVAGFLHFPNYAVVEPGLTGYVPFTPVQGRTVPSGAPPAARRLPEPPGADPPRETPEPSQTTGIPDWMK
ncbi:hypothetical protein [Desulfococcus sp.]|uniref:tellurite resistance TerB family protein n=1 Tax=Desulfococcus sp. TaxID=2025834 RepID=UPI003594821A